jgi:hypothetical protein
MKLHRPGTRSRRTVVGAGLAALAGGALGARRVEARRILSRGVTGGGLAQLTGGEEPVLVHFSLLATALQLAEGQTAFLGRLHWVEAGSGLALDGPEITECIGLPDAHPNLRQVRGWTAVNGQGRYPFVLTCVDVGIPGSADDTIELDVNGPAAQVEGESATGPDFTYAATATLVAGDLQVISVDLET